MALKQFFQNKPQTLNKPRQFQPPSNFNPPIISNNTKRTLKELEIATMEILNKQEVDQKGNIKTTQD